MIKIINTKEVSRSNLVEGRVFGLGTALFEKIDNDTYDHLIDFTSCKDYLNDIVDIENTKRVLEVTYGLKYSYQGILEKEDYIYMGVKILDNQNNSWEYFDETVKMLEDNYVNLIKFINKLENYMDMGDYTDIISFNEGILMIKIPKIWASNSCLISLYGLYLRCFLNVTEKELKTPIKELMDEDRAPESAADAMNYVQSLYLFEDGVINQIKNIGFAPKDATKYDVHSFGIINGLSQIKQNNREK